MDSIVNLDPSDPRARDAILSLLGTTLSELKEIDKNVVGSSRNISALKTDLKNVLNFQHAAPPVATTVAAGINIQPQQQHTIQPLPSPVATVALQEDPNQLVFDFNQKITPDTINNKLDRILEKIDRIIDRYSN